MFSSVLLLIHYCVLYIERQLFIVQYHIWMTPDTDGQLVLVPGHPHVNAVITSFVFVCAAHEIHYVTEQLVLFLVPYNRLKLGWNVAIGVILVNVIAYTTTRYFSFS